MGKPSSSFRAHHSPICAALIEWTSIYSVKVFHCGEFILFSQYNSEHLLSVMLYEVPMRTVQLAY